MQIKIWYTDFWSDLNPDTFYLTNMFRKTGHEIIITDESPDYVIYSSFPGNNGFEYPRYLLSKKIFYTGENIRPNFDNCDYAMTFDFIENERHLRLPIYNLYFDEESGKSLYSKEFESNRRKKFCAFIHSNQSATKRNHFFNDLCEYKQVD